MSIESGRIEFEVSGKTALFTEPFSKLSGEKFSYPVPTVEAVKGIMRSIYYKPTFTYVVDAIRVMMPIQYTRMGKRTVMYVHGGNDVNVYTYLYDVRYQVLGHIVWNPRRPDLAQDRIMPKHLDIFNRSVEHGGRMNPCLGTSECHALIDPCVFGSGEGAYDSVEAYSLGMMFHSFARGNGMEPRYPGEIRFKSFWMPVMERGILTPPAFEKCPVVVGINGTPYGDEKEVAYGAV